jgi:large subunit ribosomal protein L31
MVRNSSMRDGIHPTYYSDAVVTCSCGNTFTTGSTSKALRIDVCSKCHPFYTGQQRIVDSAGQVERFMRRQRRGGQAEGATEAAETEAVANQ